MIFEKFNNNFAILILIIFILQISKRCKILIKSQLRIIIQEPKPYLTPLRNQYHIEYDSALVCVAFTAMTNVLWMLRNR